MTFRISLSLSLAGNFRAGEDSGTIMKKSDANERNALKAIMDDILKPYVPEFKKVVEQDDGSILFYSIIPQLHTHHSNVCSSTHPAHSWHSCLLFPQQFQPSYAVNMPSSEHMWGLCWNTLEVSDVKGDKCSPVVHTPPLPSNHCSLWWCDYLY